MSGQRFAEALQRIGFPGACSEADGGSYDWIFEYDSVVPFLDWFCDEIQASNRLDPKDVEEFYSLERSPEGILEGDQLEEALQNVSAGDEGEELTDDKLREEITELEDELQACLQRKELLLQQRNKLSAHKTSVADRLSKLDGVKSLAKTKYKHHLEEGHTDSTKMDAALAELLAAVADLSALYQNSCSVVTEEQRALENTDSVFFSQLSLDKLYQTEDKFTSELTAYTKKQFFEGIAAMTGENEGSRYEFLEISNPDSLLVSGEKESIIYDACKEIARLQINYPKSENLYINALIEEKCTAKACAFMEQKIQQLREKPYPTDPSELSNRLKDARTSLAVLRHDLAKLSEEVVPTVVKDSATLQVTKILRGNYDLKIARQDYFMSNQQQVIDQLVIQRSRNELLTMAFELEVRGHRDTYRLVTAINMLLQKLSKAHEDRMEMLKDPILTTSRRDRSTLDSRDKFFTKLHRLLDPEGLSNQPQLFLTYKQLSENADRLQHQVASLRASASTANTSQDDKLHTLERTVRLCESSLYSGSSTTGGHPTLSPQSIADSMVQLDTMLKKLEASVMDIIKDVDQKKKTLHNDSLLTIERELYVYFFTDPDRLRRCIDDVSRKLDARLVT